MAEQPELGDSAVRKPPITAAHVIHSLGAGGAETVLVELARTAVSAGLRLVVIGLSDAHTPDGVDRRVVAQLKTYGATVYELHAARYNPLSAITVARILRHEFVEIVHTHLKHADVVGSVAARMVGVPSVSTLHVIDVPMSRAHELRVRAAALARRRFSSTVIAVSRAQRDWYRRYAGPKSKVVVLPNGVGEPEVVRGRDAIRAEIGVPGSTPLAMCVSLMRPEKGHVHLLEALRRLPDDIPLIVGLAGDGPLFNEIRSTIAAEPVLRRRARVLGFRRDTADLLAASDFVIQPSLEDALPTSLISALAAGKPIVASNVGGIPDIVGAGCGVLVEPHDAVALSNGIVEMASMVRCDPSAHQAMRLATRERYESHFSADVWTRNLRSVYEQAVGGRGTASLHRLTAVAPEVPRTRRIVLVEFPPSGGLYQFSVQLGDGLARSGEHVQLITGPHPELMPREPTCRVHSILPTWHPSAGADVSEPWRRVRRGVRAVRLTAAWAVLLAYLFRTQPDVVIWSEWRFPVDGWGVHLVRKALPNSVLALVAHEPRVLVEQPGHSGIYKTSRLTNHALAKAFADLDVAFVLGESAKEALLDTWSTSADVHIIPHGDEGVFAAAAIPGPETSGPVVLCFGTMTAYKGLDTLLEAWPTVRAGVPDAELIVAGALSPDVDRSLLLARVASLEGVRIDIGYVPIDQVSKYFAAARCVVLPYKRCSQSGVAHLAHTMGRPVVATRVGDIPSVVRHDVSGLLVPPGDVEALAAALVRVLTNPELARQLGEAGAQALLTDASWEEVATQVKRGLPPRRLTG